MFHISERWRVSIPFVKAKQEDERSIYKGRTCELFARAITEYWGIIYGPKDSYMMLSVITKTEDAFGFFDDLVSEVERRISLFNDIGARKIEEYNQLNTQKKLPYIVVIVDEFSSLMMEDGKRFETLIKRITAVARFLGIHLVISTNRCSSDVITGVIKSNFPTQIAFAVNSGLNSRIIMDQLGAEKLLGSGDMLFCLGGKNSVRVQGAVVDIK